MALKLEDMLAEIRDREPKTHEEFFEPLIDQAIKNQFRHPNDTVKVSFDDENFDKATVDKLKKIYRKAGWKVDQASFAWFDQREGRIPGRFVLAMPARKRGED